MSLANFGRKNISSSVYTLIQVRALLSESTKVQMKHSCYLWGTTSVDKHDSNKQNYVQEIVPAPAVIAQL
jgi:hypothetical protein